MEPIYPKSGKEFKKASEGQHSAVLASIEDLGIVDTGYEDDNGQPKLQPYVRLFLIVDEIDDSGAPLQVNEDFHNSSHEKAKLFQMFQGLGITINPTTDLNQFIGQQVLLDIHHNTSRKGKVYANILHPIKPAPENAPFIRIPKGWVAPKFNKRAGGSLAGSVQDGPTIRPGLTTVPKLGARPAATKQTVLEVPYEGTDEDIPV